MARINCLGSLMVDAISGPIERYPEPKVRTLVVTKFLQFAVGGGVGNSSSALARMRLKVGVFSKIGDDPNGNLLLRELSREGIDTSGIRISAGENTPFTFVGVHPDGDRTFLHTPGTNLTFAPHNLDMKSLLDADYLFYQDCWLQPSLDGAPGAKILAEAKHKGMVTLLDACWGLGPRRNVLEVMLPFCDYFIPSVDDMRAIYPDLSPEQMATHIISQGTGTVVLKMGAAGSIVVDRSGMRQVDAVPAKVVDTTGAGDCWDAGFLAALSSGNDVIMSARIGHACAAYCIEQVGGATGIPDYDTVVRRAGGI